MLDAQPEHAYKTYFQRKTGVKMQATDVKIEDLSLEELHTLRDMIDSDIHEREKEDRKEKRKRMKELAKELGYSVEREVKQTTGTGKRGRPPKNKSE